MDNYELDRRKERPSIEKAKYIYKIEEKHSVDYSET